MRRLRTLMLCAAAGLGCSSDDSGADGSGGGTDDGGDGDCWDEVDEPEPYTYDDSVPPHADLPDDESTWDSLEMPLDVTGTDNGDHGITYAFVLASYYILRVQLGVDCTDADGSPCGPFGYLYDPETDAWDESDLIHRQAGATFTQAWAYKVTQRPEFALSTNAGLMNLMARAVEQPDGSLKLTDIGATDLVALGMTEYARLTGSTDWDEEIDGVGAYLLNRYNDDGTFSEGGPLQWAQIHQALWRLYVHTGDVAYRDALEGTGKYHHEHRQETGDGELFQWPYLYGLWAHEPLTELYTEIEADWIPELVFFVADDVVSKQHTPCNNDDEDRMGGYHPNNGPHTPNWNHTLKLEATIDAWRLADLVGDEKRKTEYRRSAILGAQFLMRFQYRKGETDGFPNPELPIGGIPLFFDDPRIRIDIPHHGGNAMMKVADYLGIEDFPGKGL